MQGNTASPGAFLLGTPAFFLSIREVAADQMEQGIFITFEGSEGCGKSTQVERLSSRLTALVKGKPLLTLREPGGTALGEEIRRLLKLTAPGWSVVPEAELLLFAASRAQLVRETIAPTLAAGGIVICDRFLDSTTVYQGVGRRLDLREVATINEFAAGARRPDITFLLDLPSPDALERLRRRTLWANLPPDRMELELPAFYEQVRTGYLALAALHPDRVVTVNAALSPDEIERLLWSHLTARFHGLRPDHRA